MEFKWGMTWQRCAYRDLQGLWDRAASTQVDLRTIYRHVYLYTYMNIIYIYLRPKSGICDFPPLTSTLHGLSYASKVFPIYDS